MWLLMSFWKKDVGFYFKVQNHTKTIGIKNSTHELPFFPMLANFSKVKQKPVFGGRLPSFVFYTV